MSENGCIVCHGDAQATHFRDSIAMCDSCYAALSKPDSGGLQIAIWLPEKTAKETREFLKSDKILPTFDEFVIDDDFPGEKGTEVHIWFYPDKTSESYLKHAWTVLNDLPRRLGTVELDHPRHRSLRSGTLPGGADL